MELKFDEKDIKALLILQAKQFGIEANTVEFEGSYGSVRSATVSFDPDKEEAKPAFREVA